LFGETQAIDHVKQEYRPHAVETAAFGEFPPKEEPKTQGMSKKRRSVGLVGAV
jgi:hypothetical protein